jgi:hypothetical protein
VGYYRNYYAQRGEVMNAILDNIGGCGKESIFFSDNGEKIMVDGKYVTVNKENTIVQEGDTMVEDNTDTLTGCKCDSCTECGCDPEVCKCGCHAGIDNQGMFKMENIGE